MDHGLRITHVLTSLHVGGAERMALLLASAQRDLGHRVDVVSLEAPPDGALADEFEQASLPVRGIAKRPSGYDLTLGPRLALHFARTRPDVVHTHNELPLVYAAPPARANGARVLHTEHGSHPASGRGLWLRRASALTTSCFVAVSEATATFVRERRYVSSRKLRVIQNATDLTRFKRVDEVREETRRAWGAGANTWVIGTVGRMAEVKNHALLIRAAAPMLTGDAMLVIAGDGPLRDASEELARELGVASKVRFLGLVSDVPSVLSGLDVFALSSTSEGLPMVLAEAMGASLPVVATAVGGVPRVVDEGDTGFLVPSNDEQALRDRLDELRADPSLARRLGERGERTAAARYALDRMARDYLEAYG